MSLKFIYDPDKYPICDTGPKIKMELADGSSKDYLYTHFLDFLRACGYHINYDVELTEVDPNEIDEYTRHLEDENDCLKDELETLRNEITRLKHGITS